MPSSRFYIACDLGAGSGRVILGCLREKLLELEEIHRFPNEPVRIRGSLRWNILGIFQELKTGLRKVAASGRVPESLSVDSWGVDYVLLNEQQPVLGIPYQYRDARTDTVYEQTIERLGRELIFSNTGIQFMSFNTLYQLIAEVERDPALIELADQFLNIADYFHFLFSGAGRAEESLASTTQVFDPMTRSWSDRLIDAAGLPRRIFPTIVPSGTSLGAILPELQDETGLGSGVQVIATCSHDTGAAVAAVPGRGDDWAYLSSGTWSLIGVELPAPLINDKVRHHNFTNEAGYAGTTRFLKNIAGMWLLQESQRTWKREGRAVDYAELTRQAEAAEPLRSLINPNSPRFAKPDEMPGKIAGACRETGQPVPETQGQFVRCILESLALLYNAVLEELATVTGRDIRRIHIVGGGSQSALLNQFTADATDRAVFAGPVEATAAGNVLIQAIALGHIESLTAAREIVRSSFPIQEFQPRPGADLRQAVPRFAKITSPK
jgi:rhamnulokinase